MGGRAKSSLRTTRPTRGAPRLPGPRPAWAAPSTPFQRLNPMTDPLYQGCTVGDLVVRAVARGGDRVAFISDDTRWTYRELGALISQVVQALAARGLKRGDAVATLSANRPEAFLIDPFLHGLTAGRLFAAPVVS